MAKLYLIRRNLEGFCGPMTLMELKDSFKRMQFGLSDEVSGHCGPWVILENFEKLKKTYPEVGRIVYEDVAADWGVSNHGEHKVISSKTQRIKAKSARGLGLAVAFLLIAIGAFIAAIFMANSSKMSSKARELPDHNPRPDDAQAALGSSEKDEFLRYMQSNLLTILERSQAGRPDAEAWLPYLRSYAFQRDGQIAGLDSKLLRGAAVAAPVDCSLKSWTKRWRSSTVNWKELISEHQLVHAHWARVLAWDPNWIRRHEHKGWLPGENYYLACLVMADKGLSEMLERASSDAARADLERSGLLNIKARLEWQIAAVRGALTPPTQPPQTSDLELWTCFEAASDFGALSRCRSTLPKTIDPMTSYIGERYSWNLLRLAVAMPATVTGDMEAQLGLLTESLGSEDHFTRFDYPNEARLIHSLTAREVPASKSPDRGAGEVPHAKPAH